MTISLCSKVTGLRLQLGWPLILRSAGTLSPQAHLSNQEKSHIWNQSVPLASRWGTDFFLHNLFPLSEPGCLPVPSVFAAGWHLMPFSRERHPVVQMGCSEKGSLWASCSRSGSSPGDEGNHSHHWEREASLAEFMVNWRGCCHGKWIGHPAGVRKTQVWIWGFSDITVVLEQVHQHIHWAPFALV